jgi:anti-sigma factor RsiW
MSCDTPKTQLYLYLDGELATPEAATVAQHLQQCDTCQQEAATHYRLQSLVCATLSQEEVPGELWTTIRQKLPSERLTLAQRVATSAPRRFWGGAMATAALLVLAFGIRAWLVAPVSTVVQEIVDSQIRSQLMQTAYQELPADPGEIRRWFHDKVEFSVLVPTVPTEGYTLLGVRLNYFLNRRVAEIAYASHSHILSFLMFSDKDITLKSMRVVRVGERLFYVQKYKGYNTVLWKDGAYFCSLVSDLHLTSLLRLAQQVTGSNSAS